MRPLATPLRRWSRVSWIGWMNSHKSQEPYVLARQSVQTLSRQRRAEWRVKLTGACLWKLRNRSRSAGVFPEWTEADLSEHVKRARANPLRAAGLSKVLVEGDSQPCVHDIGIKPGDTCAAAGFNLFFQQFQEVLRTSLKQADLVAEIPLGQKTNFLSSPVNTTVALNGPTFVGDDAVLLSGDSQSQLIDKMQEATRIHVDTTRNFGQTLNFNRKNRGAGGRRVLSCSGSQTRCSPYALFSEFKHVGTWVSSAASTQRCLSWPNLSRCEVGCSEKFWKVSEERKRR